MHSPELKYCYYERYTDTFYSKSSISRSFQPRFQHAVIDASNTRSSMGLAKGAKATGEFRAKSTETQSNPVAGFALRSPSIIRKRSRSWTIPILPRCIDNDDPREVSPRVFPVVVDEVFKRFTKAEEYIGGRPLQRRALNLRNRNECEEGEEEAERGIKRQEPWFCEIITSLPG